MTSLPVSNSVLDEVRPMEVVTETTTTTEAAEAPEKKVRKAYTITKSRESWSEGEHVKFLEALQLFDRDWKKIEDFVGSKTVIQIRSHAQKYFLKVQKNGTLAHVPPPRPKRKAAHPYPQKASKDAQMSLHVSMTFPTQINNLPGYTPWDDDTSALLNIAISRVIPPQDELGSFSGEEVVIGSNDITSASSLSASGIVSSRRTLPNSKGLRTVKQAPSMHGLPNFAEVYNFIGSVFDPDSKGRMKKLKEMDPINFETVMLLMRNLTVNLSNPDFEPVSEHYDAAEEGPEQVNMKMIVQDPLSRTLQVIYLLDDFLLTATFYQLLNACYCCCLRT